MSTEYKVIDQDEAEKISRNLRKKGKIIVTTNGSFDILHYAHINLLERAAEEGILFVLVNSDKSVKRFKGDSRPIVPQEDRARMLAALECVGYVTIFDEDKPLDLIARLKPQIHAKGGTYIPERVKEEQELMAQWGGRCVYYPLEEGVSTTNIINEILEKNK